MSRAVKYSTEQSQAWLIYLETFAVGALAGWLAYDQFQVHPAIAIVICVVVMLLLKYVIVKFAVIFWLWTSILSALAGMAAGVFIQHRWEDMTWSVVGGGFAVLVVAGMHIASRRHIQIEEDADQVTVIR